MLRDVSCYLVWLLIFWACFTPSVYCIETEVFGLKIDKILEYSQQSSRPTDMTWSTLDELLEGCSDAPATVEKVLIVLKENINDLSNRSDGTLTDKDAEDVHQDSNVIDLQSNMNTSLKRANQAACLKILKLGLINMLDPFCIGEIVVVLFNRIEYKIILLNITPAFLSIPTPQCPYSPTRSKSA